MLNLGVKDSKNRVYLYNSQGALESHISQLGEQITKDSTFLSTIHPYPFDNFIHVKNDAFWTQYTSVYLNVEVPIDKDSWKSMRAGDIRSCEFKSEVYWDGTFNNQPFAYALSMYRKYPSLAWNMITWVIHDEPQSDSERAIALSIIKNGIDRGLETGYPLDLTIDKYTIRYMPEVYKYVDSSPEKTMYRALTLGMYGNIDITGPQLDDYLKLTPELTIRLLSSNTWFSSIIAGSKQLTMDFLKTFTDKQLVMFTEHMYIDSLTYLKTQGIDVDWLFSVHYKAFEQYKLTSIFEDTGKRYYSLLDYLNDDTVSPSKEDLQFLINGDDKDYYDDDYYYRDDDDYYDYDYNVVPDERGEALNELFESWILAITPRPLAPFLKGNIRDLMIATYSQEKVDEWDEAINCY